MNKENAIADAKRTAKNYKARIAVVNAPIEMAEENDGPFGYAPSGHGVETLFRHATIVGFAEPNGDYADCSPKPVISQAR